MLYAKYDFLQGLGKTESKRDAIHGQNSVILGSTFWKMWNS